MFGKFLILAGVVPVFVSLLVRKFLGDRAVKKHGDHEGSITGQELVEKILKKGEAKDVELVIKPKSFLKVGPQKLLLAPNLASSKRAVDVAEAGLLAGMVLMARRQENVVAWRAWALKFGWAFPVFSTVVMIFAMVVGKLSASLSLGIISGSIGLTTVLLWFTLPVERAAGHIVAEMLEDTALVPRRNEGERLAKLVRALSWRRVIPGAISWLTGK